MQAFIICELIAIFLLTIYLMHYYAAKHVHIAMKIFILIPWFLCFLTIILTPIDVYYSYTNDTDSAHTTTDGDPVDTESLTASKDLQGTWRGIYWTSFFMSWFGLPYVKQYVEAGDFTPKDKIKRAVRANLRSYATMLILGLVFVIYLAITDKLGTEGLAQYLVTFSQCFGIFLIIVCLGFGLVRVPKRYIEKTNKQVNLKYYQYKLAEVEDGKLHVEIKLQKLVQGICAITFRKDVDAMQKDLLETILSQCSEEFVNKGRNYINALSQKRREEIASEYGDITHEKIVILNKKVKKAITEVQRLEHKYQTTLESALFAEDIVDSKTPEEWYTKFNQDTSVPMTRTVKYKNWIRWAWYTKVEQVVFFIIGVLFAIISISVFVLEILTFLQLDLFSVDKIIGNSFATSQVICLIPLLYISLCVYFSLFSMKLSSQYGLYPHHTDSGSLVFASVNFSRVTTPLIFNFLQMNQLTHTNYNLIMGNASLAYSFVKYFPIILVLLVLAQVFDVYGRLMNSMGLKTFRFTEDYNDNRIDEGKAILAKVRKAKLTGMKERGISRIVRFPSTISSSPSTTLNTQLLGRTERLDSSTSSISSGRDSRLVTLAESPDRKQTGKKGDTYQLEMGKI